jgi:phage minor structural protein
MAEIISIYDKNETDFTTNGTILTDVVICEIEEELNGKYLLELTHLIDAKGKWELLVEENVIKADGQLFRIHKSEKDLDYITVYARHIFYDLLSNFLEDVRPTNLNGAAAIDWVLTGTQYSHPFIGTSDITGTNTAYFIRKNPVEAILGPDGLTERWSAELERDNYQIRLWESRGEDKGARIVYGKNMIGIDIETNYDDVVTRICPVGVDGLLLPEMYVDSPLIGNYAFPRIKTIDLDVEVDDETTQEQAYQQMRDECALLYSANKIDLPYESITADLLLLENTEEYKNFNNLIKVELGDTVGCTDNPLNITFSSRVVRVRKDVLADRNLEVELNSYKRYIL